MRPQALGALRPASRAPRAQRLTSVLPSISTSPAPTGLWKTAACVLDGYVKAEEVSLHATIEDGLVVLLKVKVEKGAEEPALLLEEIWTLEDALGRFLGGVVVNVAPEDEHLLPDLRRMVDEHKGRAPPSPFRSRASTAVRAGGDCRVAISERFARDVDTLLGKGRVRLARV